MTALPLKWHGGKHYLAKEIIKRFPKHTHYVEPFFGGGAVLFQKPVEWIEGHSEVVADIDRQLTNFWRVLAYPSYFEAFKRRVEAIPFSELEWNDTFDLGDINLQGDMIECAVAFFVRFRQSRQGLGKCFGTLSRNRTRRGMNEQASAWLSAVDGLDEAHERLRRVVVLGGDAIEVIQKQDGPNTFFYLDPPYLPETRKVKRAYQYEMTTEQHVELLELLSGIQGKFLLSAYHHSIYDQIAKQNKWKFHEISIDNKASSAQVKPIQIEVLWRNYEL